MEFNLQIMNDELLEKLCLLWYWKKILRHEWDARDIWNLIGENWDIESSNNLKENEKLMILNALDKNNWQQKAAAKELGISRRCINYKLQKYNITNDLWRKHK